jgi:hypothetical protein
MRSRNGVGGRGQRSGGGSSGSGSGGGSGRAGRFSRGGSGTNGRYIVFVKRPTGPVPVWIRTGLTDLDYSEVISGLSATDSVLVLPSASLVESQKDFKERINRVTGGGGVPGMQQQTGRTGAGNGGGSASNRGRE